MKTNYNFKKIATLIWSIFIFTSLFSQENYLPGYIITLKGDTIKGQIDYQNWLKNPQQIFFKNKQSEVLVYVPLSIREFSVQGEVYLSATIEKEVSSIQT